MTGTVSTAYPTQTEEDVKQYKRNAHPENMNVSVQTHPDIVFQMEHGAQTYCSAKKDATKAREDVLFPQTPPDPQTHQDEGKGQGLQTLQESTAVIL